MMKSSFEREKKIRGICRVVSLMPECSVDISRIKNKNASDLCNLETITVLSHVC